MWSLEATAMFDALKRALSTALVMQLPDFDKPFPVDYDASGPGFEAVLHQGDGAWRSSVVRSRRATL